MKISSKERQQLSNKIAEAANGGPILQDFLNNIKGLHPEIAAATEGIYCGRAGRAATPCFEDSATLVLGWYTTLDDAKCARVEYAYLS